MVNTPFMPQSSIAPPAINIEIRESKTKSTSEKKRILQKNTQLMGVPVFTNKALWYVLEPALTHSPLAALTSLVTCVRYCVLPTLLQLYWDLSLVRSALQNSKILLQKSKKSTQFYFENSKNSSRDPLARPAHPTSWT